ncbi:MAG: DNA polymerase III subunit delta [Deltaproteobacteria bacterium]|nr:DNA polymerase III subunit delta [Deltaproteobacteria bacterium]
MQGTLKTALDNIGRGKTASCYLIHGDEEYLVEDAMNRIIDGILPPDQKDLNLFHMEGEDEDIGAICNSILTPPLIPGKKVVLVRNTHLFYSKASSSDVIREITSNIEKEPRRAAIAFASLMEIAGWSLEELKDEQWKKISDDDWRSAIGGTAEADRRKWLPKVIDLCDRLKITGGGKPKDTDKLEGVLKSGIPDGNCLIMTAGAVDKRKRLFKAMKDVGIVLSFSMARNEAERKGLFKDKIRDVLVKRGKRLAPDAFLPLGEKTGFKLRDSLKEIEKLIVHVGDRETIDRNDIEAVIEKTAEDSVFDLTAAIMEKNAGKALQILRQLFDQGANHILILTMIAREVRLLFQGNIILESGEIPAFRPGMDYRNFQAGIYPSVKNLVDKYGGKGKWLATQHPYVIYKTFKNAGRFSREELIGYMKHLADLDLALKSSGIDPQLALKRLLIGMCRRR